MSFGMYFHFLFWISLYFLLHQIEAMSAFDQLKENKQEGNIVEKKTRRERGKRKKIAKN
jgi:hypothetical protein